MCYGAGNYWYEDKIILHQFSFSMQVLNSLDAKSSSIAVRVNLKTFHVQVEDDGRGISKSDMNLVGLKSMTSKCKSLGDLKDLKCYGFRGEALASIVKVSEKVNITSRHEGSKKAYKKEFLKGIASKVTSLTERMSPGCIVTIENLLFNIPHQRNLIKPDLHMQKIKKDFVHLAVIHPNVSFSLKNEFNGNVTVFGKTGSLQYSIVQLCTDIESGYLLNAIGSTKKFRITGLVYGKAHHNKHLQLLYVNKRIVFCGAIQKLIDDVFQKKWKGHGQYPAYVLNIQCLYQHVDITLYPSKTTAFFKDLDVLTECIEKILCKLWRIESKKEVVVPKIERKVSDGLDVMKMKGAVMVIARRRKSGGVETRIEFGDAEQRKNYIKRQKLQHDEHKNVVEAGNLQKPNKIGNEVFGSSNLNDHVDIDGIFHKKGDFQPQNDYLLKSHHSSTLGTCSFNSHIASYGMTQGKNELEITFDEKDSFDLNLPHLNNVQTMSRPQTSYFQNITNFSDSPRKLLNKAPVKPNKMDDVQFGKELIMNIFLKSTWAYRNEFEKPNSRPQIIFNETPFGICNSVPKQESNNLFKWVQKNSEESDRPKYRSETEIQSDVIFERNDDFYETNYSDITFEVLNTNFPTPDYVIVPKYNEKLNKH